MSWLTLTKHIYNIQTLKTSSRPKITRIHVSVPCRSKRLSSTITPIMRNTITVATVDMTSSKDLKNHSTQCLHKLEAIITSNSLWDKVHKMIIPLA